MGNDGGSIPTRRELVKEAARNPTTAQIKESQHEKQEYFWTTDPVSQKPLVQPIVSDAYGTLYNKDTILEFLLEGARSEDVKRTSHDSVKTLKDVVEVKFATDESTNAWKCPMIGDKLGPGSKAVYLVPCGHAFSDIAVRSLFGEQCMICDADYALPDVIPIVSTVEADVTRLTLRLQSLQKQRLTHSLEKAARKKRKKADDVADADNTTTSDDTKSSINNASTASLTAKVLLEQDSSKKRKTESDNVRSLFSSKDQTGNKNNDFMTRGFSVPVKR